MKIEVVAFVSEAIMVVTLAAWAILAVSALAEFVVEFLPWRRRTLLSPAG